MKLDNFINRPVLSTVISILIVILGAIGLATLPITQYPDIAPPTVSVRATYTGASASTVLNSVIAPLEEQINGVENMMYMTSTASNTGSGDISIYFKQGTDPDLSLIHILFILTTYFKRLFYLIGKQTINAMKSCRVHRELIFHCSFPIISRIQIKPPQIQ